MTPSNESELTQTVLQSLEGARDARLARGEARVREKPRPLDRVGEPLPELFGRGHVQRDPQPVRALQHIGLRHARAAERPHDLALGKEVGERVEVEVAHGLELSLIHI